MGMTYGRLFSSSSLSIHSSITSSPYEYSFKKVQHYFTVVSLICSQIVNVCKELMEIAVSEEDRQFSKGSKETIDKLISKQCKEFDAGDVVLAAGDLAEILKKIKGEFGYTSYKIKYLGKPPIPDIQVDSWPSFLINPLIRKNNPQEFVDKFKSNKDMEKGIRFLKTQPTEKPFEALKKTLMEIEKMGMLDKVLFGDKTKA